MKLKRLIQQRRYFYGLSIALVVASVVSLSLWGLRLGLDFRGGTLLEVSWHANPIPDRAMIETTLRGVEHLDGLVVQPSGDRDTLIRYVNSDEAVNEAVLEKLKTVDKDVELVRTDFIGASVSDQIKKNAILAVILAIIGIALFIAWAFRKVSRPVSSWQYGLQAVVALGHDLLITIGVFSILGHFYGVEVGAPFIAALLTILGYSVNDTIVVYDRIRENLLRSGGGGEDFESTVNRSLNETIARSFNTSFTVIIVLLAIVIWGGESIRPFALALLVGVAAGTYSSIYVASALLVTSNTFRERYERRGINYSGEKKKSSPKLHHDQSDRMDKKEMKKEDSELSRTPIVSNQSKQKSAKASKRTRVSSRQKNRRYRKKGKK